MSLLTTFVSAGVASLTIKTDKDAIQSLLKIIDDSPIELDEYDQAVVNFIKNR